ncbi:hypothetical protein [Numidum massiliense]|uniref:hypothetical protein n=1 Tax=Numidum massiliense TaxID=1522315 RepID=UPI00164EC300|nr:hypothetical protein [Numidum massiliense]
MGRGSRIVFMLYTFLYPLGALALCALAVALFPFAGAADGRDPAKWLYWLYDTVDYLFALLLFVASMLILRRVVVRAASLILLLERPLWRWGRLKHVATLLCAGIVLSYAFAHLFLHTLAFVGFFSIHRFVQWTNRLKEEEREGTHQREVDEKNELARWEIED